MDPFPSDRRSPRARPQLRPVLGMTVLSLAAPVLLVRPVLAGSSMGSIVRAFCLSAFENEMSQAGKTAPQGMANFACSCVEDRLRSGTTLDAAKRDCRQETARRYPI